MRLSFFKVFQNSSPHLMTKEQGGYLKLLSEAINGVVIPRVEVINYTSNLNAFLSYYRFYYPALLDIIDSVLKNEPNDTLKTKVNTTVDTINADITGKTTGFTTLTFDRSSFESILYAIDDTERKFIFSKVYETTLWPMTTVELQEATFLISLALASLPDKLILTERTKGMVDTIRECYDTLINNKDISLIRKSLENRVKTWL